mgnify:CR=1 FL=1
MYKGACGDVMPLILSLLGLLLSMLASATDMRQLSLLTEDYPPFNMPGDKPGEVAGIATEIVQQLMVRSGYTYKVRLYPWQRAISTAQAVPDNCVFSMSRTPERERLYSWVGPLLQYDWVMFAREYDAWAATADTLEAFKEKRIGSYQGDAIVSWLQERGYKLDIAVRDDANPRKLLAGRIDLWATGALAGQYILRQQNITDIVPRLTFHRSSMYLACHRDLPADEVKHLNHELQQMREDGSICAIYKRNGYIP